MLIKNFFIIISFFVIQPRLEGLFMPPPFQEATKSSGLSFLSGAEARKKQLVTLDEELKNVKNEFQNDRKIITQNLLATLDLFKEIEDSFTKRAKIVTEIIEFMQGKQKKSLKALYTWQEFRDSQ